MKPNSPALLSWCALWLCASLMARAAICNPVVLPAQDQGWYDSNGHHDAGNDNYFCGDGVAAAPLRNWFVFNIPLLSQPVTSAELRVNTFGINTPTGSETYELREVTTPAGGLMAGGSGLTSIFDDLGDGPVYGSQIVLSGAANNYITIPLNAAFISNLTAAAGGTISVGGQLTSLDGLNNNEYLFGSSGAGSPSNRSVQLHLTYSNGNALTFVLQPNSQSVIAGGTASFAVQVCGGGSPSYQWQRFGTNLPGATSPQLQMPGVLTSQAGPYRAVVTDGLTTVTSLVANLSVSNGVAPTGSIYICTGQSPAEAGSTVGFCAQITGLLTPTWQWRHNGTNLPGQVSPSLYLYEVRTNQSGNYTLVASNLAGVFTSAPIALVVIQIAPSGFIYLAGGSATPPAESTVTLCASISGGPFPALQWQFNSTNLPGQTGSCLYLSNLQSNQSGLYRLVASNAAGAFTSAPIALAVQYSAPSGYIYVSNGGTNPLVDSYVLIYSSISAAPAPVYQWQLNGTNLVGENYYYLQMFNVTSNQNGLYRVVANNILGGFTSAPIALTVRYQAPTGSIYLATGTSPAPAGSTVGYCSSIVAAPAAALQWQRDGVNLPGETSSCLWLYGVTSNEAGLYRLVASNTIGAFTSAPIALAVNYFAPTGSIYVSYVSNPAPAGSSPSLCSSMVGAPPASTFQWQFHGTNLPGATNGCLNLFNVTSNEAGSYRLIAGNSVGTGTSAPVVLAVNYAAPTASIFLSYGRVPTTVGNGVTLCSYLSGAPYPAVQWQFHGTNLPGQTASCLYLSNLQTNQSGPYTIVASNSLGVVTSAVAVLTVLPPQPLLAYLSTGLSPLLVGSYHYLYAETQLPGLVSLQWRLNGVDLPGFGSYVFYLYPVQTSSAGTYTVVATTATSGSYTSPPVVVEVYFAPPTSASPQFFIGQAEALLGEDIGLSAAYAGSPAVIQWRFNGANLPGQTNSTLNLLGLTTNQAGQYSFTAINLGGATTSSVVTLTVGYQAPVFQMVPYDLSVAEGATARFTAQARGGPLPQHYLEHEGANVPVPYNFEGCCTGGFNLFDTTLADAGSYRIIASNSLGMATSTVATLTITLAGPLDRWTQRNPLPQSQPLLAVAHGAGQFVAVGERGTILTSPNGANWALQNRRADVPLHGVAYGNGVFVAVGDGGTILSSADGTNWSYRFTAAGTFLYAVTHSEDAGLFVAVGVAPGLSTLAMYSSDGVNWTRVSLNGYYAQMAVTYGHGRFVAAGSSSILTSTDGTSWSLAQTVTRQIESLTYADGQYVAVGDDGTMLTSSDGSSWQSLPALTARRLLGVAHGAGRFVAAGARGTMLTSTDGYVWSAISSGTPDRLETVDYSGGRFVAVGENGTIITSNNGLDWTTQSLGVTRDLDGMHVANGTLLIVGKGGSILSSTDGTHYTTPDSGVTNDLHGVTWGGGLWIAVGEPGVVLTSPNGVDWTSRATGTTNSLKDATYAEGQWMVVGTQGTIVRSTDGVNWSTTFTSPGYDLNDVAYGHGMFLVAGDGNYNRNGSVFKSTDGTFWSHVSFYPGKNLRGVTFERDRFLFTGNDGYLFWTTNGVFFNNSYVPYYANMRAATWAHGLWIVVGNYGGIFTSPDLNTWTRRASRTFENQHQVALLGGKLVVIGNRGGVLQSDRFITEVEPPVFVPGFGFRLPFKGVVKQAYQIQASPNLVNWTNLLTFTNLTEQGSFSDPASLDQPRRFYRLVQP